MKYALFAFALLSATGASATLVASYSFSGNTLDGSGNAFHGTLHGARYVADRFGNANSALAFDGAGDYVSAPISGLAGPVSVSGWFRFEGSIWPHHMAILGQGTDYSNRWQLGASNQEIFWYDRRGSDNSPYKFTRETSAGDWHHIAAVVSDDPDTALKTGIWLDGIFLGTLSPRGFLELDAEYRIGSFWTEWGWEYSLGQIDDVNVFDHLLSEAEILDLYHASPVPEPDSLVLFGILALGIAWKVRKGS